MKPGIVFIIAKKICFLLQEINLFHKKKEKVHFYKMTFVSLCMQMTAFLISRKSSLMVLSQSEQRSKQYYITALVSLPLNFLNCVQTVLICIVFSLSRIQNIKDGCMYARHIRGCPFHGTGKSIKRSCYLSFQYICLSLALIFCAICFAYGHATSLKQGKILPFVILDVQKVL